MNQMVPEITNVWQDVERSPAFQREIHRHLQCAEEAESQVGPNSHNELSALVSSQNERFLIGFRTGFERAQQYLSVLQFMGMMLVLPKN